MDAEPHTATEATCRHEREGDERKGNCFQSESKSLSPAASRRERVVPSTDDQSVETGKPIHRGAIRQKRAKPQSVGASGPGKSSTRSPDQAGPSPSADSSLTRSHSQSHISVHPHIVCKRWLQTSVHLLYKSIKNYFLRKNGRVSTHPPGVAL